MSKSVQARIESFLAEGPWAVVGASSDRDKYGNKVLRCYQQHGLEVSPSIRGRTRSRGSRPILRWRPCPRP